MTLSDKADYVSSISDPTMPYQACLMFAKEMMNSEPATEEQFKYICFLGHRKYTTAPKYGQWQSKIVKKYHLWAFSYLTREQASLEIQKLI